ncbi:MAG: hypothetical protein PHO08_14745 [Methylococcales bacterium]|nr:hypothetical protein [Methylococcales bacterium]MDD5630869.1 hypothetical protein [Methylococcales bacterium]
MKPTKNIYPVFEANQVLTNEHLNQGFEYLDEQEHLTRANLTGIGIVCGLEISVDNHKSVIHITKGCGITSEGYLIVLPDNLTLGYYKDYVLPEGLEYTPFLNPVGKKQFNLWEITSEAIGGTALNKYEHFLDGKVVLLFVELKKEDLKDCSPNNCNDKGAKVTATIRPLLIDKINLPDSSNQNLQPVTLAVVVGLKRPKNFTGGDYINGYKVELGKILEAGKQLKSNLDGVYAKYNKKYKEYDTNPFIDFNDLLSNPEANFIQYYYDFLLDVIQAYNELICFTDRNPVWDCVPDENSFSRHLMLGSIIDEATGYRHVFKPSKALIDQFDEARSEELHLYMRLVEITKQFQPAELINFQSIKITPTHYGDFPLAQKAIPYYYDISETFEAFAELWTMGKRCSGLSVKTNSYHSPDSPLDYHLEAYNFFRIEGHVGQDNPDIQGMITDENLPFSVLTINSSEFNAFALKHPGLTHGAGVPAGGTFIMVSADGDKVIADFFLPYRVCEVCEQKESSKIWILAFTVLIIIFICLMVRNCTTSEKYPVTTAPLSQQSIELDYRQSGNIKRANDVQHWRENH